MLSFEEFQNYIEEHILEGWKENADVQIQETTKNNGVTYQGMYIREDEENVSPCMYLEEFYKDYQKGEDMEKVLSRIRQEYEWAMERSSFYEMDVLHDERRRDKIIFRLVNYEKNRELLTDCPFIRMYDLALTFRWIAHTDSIGISTALITNRELTLWNISRDELLLVAERNTRRLFPPQILHMNSYLKYSEGSIRAGANMYVLTNEQQINGATVLVYDGILKNFADRLGEDFYVLPSSIHEVLLLPVSQMPNPDCLFSMVTDANHVIVSPVDILSDSVYYYNRRDHRLTPLDRREG